MFIFGCEQRIVCAKVWKIRVRVSCWYSPQWHIGR